MAVEKSSLIENKFHRGIDAHSSEDNLANGHVADAINMDAKSAGQIEKRNGYAASYGNLPLYVQQYEAKITGSEIVLTLDSSIDLLATGAEWTPTPLLVYGTVYGTAGNLLPFSEALGIKYQWYSEDKITVTGANEITIATASTVSADLTNTNTFLWVYGINNIPSYPAVEGTRLGWVNHIDGYKTPEQLRLIAGMHGHLFYSADSVDSASIPSWSVNNTWTVFSEVDLCPSFRNSTETAGDNYYLNSLSLGGFARVESIEWVSGNTQRVTIRGTTTLGAGTPIDSTYSTLKVQKAGYTKNEGTFNVSAVNLAAGVLTIDITNPNVDSADWNESDSSAQAGSFTRLIPTTSSSPYSYEAGDKLQGGDIPEDVNLEMVGDLGSPVNVIVDNVTEAFTLSASSKAYTLSENDVLTVLFTQNIVVGDTVSVGSSGRLFKVTAMDTGRNEVTLDSDVEVLSDTDSVTVVGRWLPIPSPENYTKPFSTSSESAQEIIRSVVASDCMFLTSGEDAIIKYDGVQQYKAGLPDWQPHAFISVEPDSSGIFIPISTKSVTVTGTSGNSYVTFGTAADAYSFAVGDIVTLAGNSGTFTITDLQVISSTYYAYFNTTLNANVSSGAMTEATQAVYRYYYRLNAIDNQGNIVASAVAHSEDLTVELTESSFVHHRILQPPVDNSYDYAKWTVDVYRTKTNGTTFYQVTKIPLEADASVVYIDFTDNQADDVIGSLDPVSSALKGEELGVSWKSPQIAKYHTALGNSLIQANITTKATANIVYDSSVISSGFLDLSLTLGTSPSDLQVKSEDVSTPISISNITYAAGTLTITSAAHGIADQDFTSVIYLVYLGKNTATTAPDMRYAGWYRVTARNSTTEIEVECPFTPASGAFSAANDVDTLVVGEDRVLPVIGNISTTDYDKFVQTKDMTGGLLSYQAMFARSAARALNWASASGYFPEFEGLVAKAGNLYSPAEIIIETESEIAIAVGSNSASINGGSYSISSGTTQVKRFPSRVLISYPNYPDIMDNPYTSVEQLSDSVVDVNAEDGQEITGVIPLFGESAFGAAQTSSQLIVFKERSAYLLDINAKRAGAANIVARIDTHGIGCTYPFTICNTKRGVSFVCDEGIYKINRNLLCEKTGEAYDRAFDSIDKTGLLTSHNDTYGQKYITSVLDEDGTAMVYHYEQEGEEIKFGAWTTYNNMFATGWARHNGISYFGTNQGRVMQFLYADEIGKYAYSDDTEPISCSVTFRAQSFGDAARRKMLTGVNIGFRNETAQSSTTVSSATELTDAFSELDQLTLKGQNRDSNLYDRYTSVVAIISFKVDKQKFNFIQVKIENDGLHEPLEITQVAYRVAGLSRMGIEAASQTGDNIGN